MKKIKLLLLAVFSLLTFSGFAQSYDKTSMIETGYWNGENWDWRNPKEIDLKITLYKGKVYIEDAANTTISIYGESKSTRGYNDDGDPYTSMIWDAFDEKDRKCKFMMSIFESKALIMYVVMYDKIAFRYYCPQKSEL